MPKSLKIITIIGVLCMLVPFMVLGSFASAETVTEDGVTFNYFVYHPVAFEDVNSSLSYGFNYSNSYFTNSFFGGFPLYDSFLGIPVGVDYSFSLSNSPSFNVFGLNALVRPVDSFRDTSIITDFSNPDGLLHSYMLILVSIGAEPITFLSDYFWFNQILLSDLECSSYVLQKSFVPDDGTYLSASSSDDSITPSFVFDMFFPDDGTFYNIMNFYVLTWYGLPEDDNSLAPVLSDSFPENLYLFSFTDFSSFGGSSYNEGFTAGKQQGYDEGFTAGEQQGYDSGFTAGKQQGYDEGFTAGEQQGYDSGVTAGKQQANNIVTQNSASYLQGYQDGLNAPEYSFMSLIASVFDAPIRALFGYTQDGVQHPGLFSIDILGMNMGAFIASIFSLAVILTVLRLVLGGKS